MLVINTMKNKNIKIAGAIILALLIIAGAMFAFKDQIFSSGGADKDLAKRESPRKVTMNFYNQWLSELNSTTTTPYKSGLLDSKVLSAEVRAQIDRIHTNRKKGDVDPVLCLPKIPNRLIGREISSKNDKAVVLVLPRDKSITTEHQAIVSLTLVDEEWLITKLDCTEGEMAPVKEFDFEKSGSLLKQSIQPPFNKENWHLVYEEETQPGFVVPLTFNTESVCINVDKSESVCDPSKLTEATKVFIQAGMTEAGAVVKRMSFE